MSLERYGKRKEGKGGWNKEKRRGRREIKRVDGMNKKINKKNGRRLSVRASSPSQ